MRMLGLARFLLLSVVTMLLWTSVGATHAQYYNACCKFSTMYDECASCCSIDGDIENAIVTCDGPGPDSIGYEDLNCGTAAPGGCGVACGTGQDMVPEPDAYCESCANGPHNPCYSDEDCCGGMYCAGANPPATGICEDD